MINPFRPRRWITPPASVLPDAAPSGASGMEYSPASIAALITTLGAPCEAVAHTVGASVVQYHCLLADAVSIGKVKRLLPDISARLMRPASLDASESAHFALTVNRSSRETVHFKRVLLTEAFDAVKSPSQAILGVSPSGATIALDVADTPHMLIAGASGGGKSVALHTLLCSMLFKATPDRLRLLMIDPKQVELTMYDGLPHLLRPVITDVPAAIAALEALCVEMDRRYKLIRRGQTNFPRVIVVIDELADLMMTSRKAVEASIVRIAQLGRAAGIHLVIATQRPTVNVITGLIKANITCRIALTTASNRDSITIIDRGGAEKLQGKGDALLQTASMCGGTQRFQTAYTSPDDIAAAVGYWRSRECLMR